MKVRIRRVGVVQVGKVCAIFYGLMGLLYLPFFTVGIWLGRTEVPGGKAIMIGIMGLLLVGFPVAGFVVGIFWGVVTNLVLRLAGGFVYEYETIKKK